MSKTYFWLAAQMIKISLLGTHSATFVVFPIILAALNFVMAVNYVESMCHLNIRGWATVAFYVAIYIHGLLTALAFDTIPIVVSTLLLLNIRRAVLLCGHFC
ncbi:hypothetical protein L596_026716 [Steinernema carpocapsae]|uniref:Uncharacterized protein n=1 Tax=Steinernema carpocapsae TaxID=34508 RepID=A0A4U5M283_STECR|nr:hypothetical protein L596_026716 [Steinernema carpocapsae]